MRYLLSILALASLGALHVFANDGPLTFEQLPPCLEDEVTVSDASFNVYWSLPKYETLKRPSELSADLHTRLREQSFIWQKVLPLRPCNPDKQTPLNLSEEGIRGMALTSVKALICPHTIELVEPMVLGGKEVAAVGTYAHNYQYYSGMVVLDDELGYSEHVYVYFTPKVSGSPPLPRAGREFLEERNFINRNPLGVEETPNPPNSPSRPQASNP